MLEWPDVYLIAFEKLGLSEKKFWNLDWFEFERMVKHLHFQLAHAWEPTRELHTMLYNMFAETPVTREELIPLLIDRYTRKVQPKNDLAANKSVWHRLVAAKATPEEPKNDH